jgi:hypothetical protein
VVQGRSIGCRSGAGVRSGRVGAAGDPVLQGHAAYVLAGAAIACGSNQRGQTLAERAVGDLTPHLARPGGPEVLGSLHLVAAPASRFRYRLEDSRDRLTEASGLARRTGEINTMGMYFGPTNVDIWRMSIEVDDGDPVRVVEIARRTDPAAIPAGIRRVFYYADAARALASFGGRDREAIRFLLTAERIAPQHVCSCSECSDDPPARRLCELYQEGAQSARRRFDQDPVAWVDPGVLGQPLSRAAVAVEGDSFR